MVSMYRALIVCVVGVLAYLYVCQSISNTDDKLTQEEKYLWGNFTHWLEKNGVPKFKLKLAHFEGSGRGVAASEAINENEPLVVIPFNVMLASHNMLQTELGEAITSSSIPLSDDVFLSICLLYEKIRGDSFWKAYIDLLPTDFSNLPLFFTAEEKALLDGRAVDVLRNQERQFEDAFAVASEVEGKLPKYKGIADREGLKWAVSAVRSRMWTISELPGRTLVPLADMLNHHPSKGVALDINPTARTGTIVSNHPYIAGSEVYDKYYIQKVDSDNLYLMTFGFLMNSNDVSTYQVEYVYGMMQHSNIQEVLASRGCGTERDVLTDADTAIPPHFFECLSIAALDEVHDDQITPENYATFITKKVKGKAKRKAGAYLDEELARFRFDDEQDLLLRPNLTFNMKNILLLRKSEKKVLKAAKELLKLIK